MTRHVQFVGRHHDLMLRKAVMYLVLLPQDEVSILCRCDQHRREPVGGSRHQQKVVDEIREMMP